MLKGIIFGIYIIYAKQHGPVLLEKGLSFCSMWSFSLESFLNRYSCWNKNNKKIIVSNYSSNLYILLGPLDQLLDCYWHFCPVHLHLPFQLQNTHGPIAVQILLVSQSYLFHFLPQDGNLFSFLWRHPECWARLLSISQLLHSPAVINTLSTLYSNKNKP